MSVEEELQEGTESGSLVIGLEETIKGMDSLKKVVVASNAPEGMEDKMREVAEEAGIEVERIEQDNRQLGSMCLKPFSASVVGIQ